MQLEARKYLFDIQRAATLVEQFVLGRTLADYQQDPMLRSAVERQFEIIGEALRKLAVIDEGTANRITDFRRIIAFRNILIHGYADIDNRIVWGVVESNLRTLRREVDEMLDQ